MLPHCYCHTCKTFQPFVTEEMRSDTRYEQPGVWGDVRCLVCSTVIATLQVDQPGLYAFRKVTELTKEELPLETTKLYCNACKAIQPLDIADMEEGAEFSEKGVSGDIVEAEEGVLLGGRQVESGPVFDRFADALICMNAMIQSNVKADRRVKVGKVS